VPNSNLASKCLVKNRSLKKLLQFLLHFLDGKGIPGQFYDDLVEQGEDIAQENPTEEED